MKKPFYTLEYSPAKTYPQVKFLQKHHEGTFEKVELDTLPEVVWVVFLGTRVLQRRIEEMPRSEAILKLPMQVEIHTSYPAARDALVTSYKGAIKRLEAVSKDALKEAAQIRRLMLEAQL